MIDGGVFNLSPGEWIDDAYVVLCLAESIIECNCIDPDNQMKRNFKWWKEGYLSSIGVCFDIGIII